jgi:Meckel syndrome type 1 protein
MIARIETLRDAADAADTRIRLIPDALGAIDVALKRDGDTIHVQFTAEQAQTRALLQEAQPRLAEAAERSGLKLGQTSVEAAPASGGNSTQTGSQGSSNNPSLSQSLSQGMAQGHGQGPARQHQPATPARPVSAGSQANTADAADDDGRVA